jgi:hypothetical protein
MNMVNRAYNPTYWEGRDQTLEGLMFMASPGKKVHLIPLQPTKAKPSFSSLSLQQCVNLKLQTKLAWT